jgi:hypothetical protein
MTDEHLPPELIERVRARANDPERRSDASSAHSQTLSLDTLLDSLGPRGEQLRSIQNQLQGLMGSLGGLRVAGPMGDQSLGGDYPPLPQVATAEQVSQCEKAIGRSLPAGLKQLYTEVADGDFGPAGGLFPLARVIDEYRDMTDEPAGPQNQPWPANLLPLIDAEPGYDCLDLDSGEMVTWDPQEIEGYSNAAWLRSFKPLAPSLAAWLEEWLGRPTMGERLKAERQKAHAGAMDAHLNYMMSFYEKNPEKRAEHGLPDLGWEEEVRRRHSPPSL